MEDIDGSPVDLEGALHDLDGAIDAGAEASGVRKLDLHDARLRLVVCLAGVVAVPLGYFHDDARRAVGDGLAAEP